MLWLIVPANARSADNKALNVSVERLQANKSIPDGQADTLIVSTSKTEASTPANISGDEPKVLHVVAHAGLESKGHIGGLDLDGFGAALVAKFGTWLSNTEVYLHVCLIGRVLDGLLAAVEKADAGKTVTGTSLYAPLNLMIVSKYGIPHVYGKADAKSEDIDPIVAKHDSDYSLLRTKAKLDFLSTGEGWAGYVLSNSRAITAIDAETVKEAVLQTFDESGMEVGDLI